MANRRVIAFLIAYGLLVFVRSSEAATLELQWDPARDSVTAGFLVWFGTAPGTYAHVINVGLETSFELHGLSAGTTYYLAVQAYGTNGEFSALSSEVSGQPSAGDAEPYLSASVLSGSRVQLGWTRQANAQLDNYQIEVGTGPGRADLAIIPVSGLSFTSPVIPSGTYFMRVRALTATGLGPVSNEVVVPIGSSVICSGPPGTPTLSAAASENGVQLSWDDGRGDAPAGYVLDVSSGPERRDIGTIQFGSGTKTFSAWAPNGIYAFRLAAANACGSSPWSAEAVVTIGTEPVDLPGIPRGLTRRVLGHDVTLTWSPPWNGGEVSHYRIDVSDTQGRLLFTLDTPDAETSVTHDAVPPGTYVVHVRGANEAGLGPTSNPVNFVVRP